MTYEEAIQSMLRGKSVQRGGRTFKIDRGVYDVTDPENPVRLNMSEDMGEHDFAATDWEAVK